MAAVLAASAIVYAFVSSPSWNFESTDDTSSPVPRPAVASAIPSDATAGNLVGALLLRVQDGPPDTGLFTSTLPIVVDMRQQALDGAWETVWNSADARTDVFVEVVALRNASFSSVTMSCNPTKEVSWPAPVIQAGYAKRTATSAGFCARGLERRTQIFVAIATSEPALLPHVADRVHAIFDAVDAAVPTPTTPEVTHFKTPNATNRIRAGLLGATLGIPLLWLLPTLLFDRATWQRLAGMMTAVWRRRRSVPGIDIDRAVRSRLWTNIAVTTVQIAAAVWLVRLTEHLRLNLIGQSVTIVGCVLLIAAVQRIAYLRRAPRSDVFRGTRRVMFATGLILGIAITALALAIMFAAVSLSALGQGTSTPDYVQEHLDLAIEIIALPIVLLATLPLMMFRRFAMRTLRTEQGRDDRPPVLLLRSFADDKRRLRSRSSYRRSVVDRLGLRLWERFEEILAVSLNLHGPVYAVGQVGERLPPPLGAVRRQFSNEEWQAEVASLMARAGIICVTVGRSDALAWEIGRIAELGHLPKTIFVFPPTSRAEHLARLAVLSQLLNVPWAELNPAGNWILAVMVPEPGHPPVAIRARAQEDVGYDIALELCAAQIRGERSLVSLPIAERDLRPGPAAKIYPSGQTPKYKPLLRRRWAYTTLAVASSALVTVLFTFLLGMNPGSIQDIPLKPGLSPSALAIDVQQSTIYCVINYSFLATVDFQHNTVNAVARVAGVNDIAAVGGQVFLASSVRGTLDAYDPRTRSVLWRLSGLPGVQGLTLHGKTLTLLVPGKDEVQTVDIATGRTQALRKVAGVPWSDTLAGGSLYVSIMNRHEVLTLDPTTLHLKSRTPSRPDPEQLVTLGNTAWVYSATTHTVAPVGATSPILHLRNVAPVLASNGKTMAIEGIDQVTTVSRNGSMRQLLINGSTLPLAVTSNDDVIVAAPAGIIDIHS
jgi:hypothetical protein